MAAELLLIFAVEESLKKLGSVATDRISRALVLKRDLKKLGATTRMIQDVLQDAAEKQANDDHVKEWLEKLQDVVYSAGDVLDEISYETLRRQVEIQGRLKLKAREFVSRNNPILFRLKMSNKVKKINESLADIEKEASRKLKLTAIARANREVAVESQLMDRKTDSLLGRSEVPIGRTEDVESIINMLQVGSSNPPLLTVISIVGIGGLGKTTLAKLVLKEAKEKKLEVKEEEKEKKVEVKDKEKEKKLFDKVMWVCVSEAFDYQRILLEMLQNLDINTGALLNDTVILQQLQHKLENKRFLLVLDDVWNDNPTIWNSLKCRLEKICSSGGNFIIVTTRSLKVAEVMGTTTPEHLVKLKQLPYETCLSIIKNKWFEKWGEPMPRDLETSSVEIAKRCGGVPLAAQVLGGTLCSQKEKKFWSSIQTSNVWGEIGEDKGILPILKLSFDHLPPPLKQCFAYCSLFPKDFVFNKEMLIQLWMAEEFLNATSTIRGAHVRVMEDVGEEYLNNLVANSFFQDVQINVCGKITEFKMHDLLHDLAKSISNTQSLPPGSNCIFKTSDGRRLNFDYDQVSRFEEVLTNDDARNLRVLFSKVDSSPLLPNCKSLRSLNISGAKLKEIPLVIGKLKHLRYLDISRNESILALPESITKLYNLQTLRLLECKSLKELPRDIGNLVSLRHIHFDDKRLMIFKVGHLTSLQTLPYFVVGLEEGYKICELEGLTELRGEVEFSNLENVGDGKEAKRAELEKKKLFKLILVWNEVEENEREASSSSGECNHEDVLTSLQPAPGLLSLTIECYMGKGFPQWMSIKSVNSPYPLENLVNLELKNCKKCENMPTIGHLPFLKVLVVEGMDCVKCMGSEFNGESNNLNALFPALEEFSISKMKSLVKWMTPEGIGLFPKLCKLDISDCPCLKSFPLSQLTSSAIGMHIEGSYSGGDFVRISCLLDLKSLEYMSIRRCPELTFLHIGLTSFQELASYGRHFRSWLLEDFSEKLSVSSNGLDKSLKVMEIGGTVETIQEFPKFLKALEIRRFNNNLLADAFDGLPSLEYLKIEECNTLESIPHLSSLTSLNHLVITRCSRLKSIPTISSLTSLKHLQISCDSLESIPTYSSLTSLNHLEIKQCRHPKSIPPLSSLTSLNHLEIVFCNSLESIPSLSSLPSLQILKIQFCRNLSDLFLDLFSPLTCLEELWLSHPKARSLPSAIKSCQSLKELVIHDWNELSDLSSISFSTLTRLEKLSISFCPKLRSLPGEIKLCTSLKELSVIWCGGLVNIDDDMIGSLTQLKKLNWGGFSGELDQVPSLNSIHLLPSLQKVTLGGWYKLTSLPHQLQHLTFITELEISSFSGVERLPDWLCDLTSLQSLSISGCENLKNLPIAMQHLSKLTRLEIRRCPHLQKRCVKDIGSEWSNISHIPHIEIDGEFIQYLTN